MSYLNHEYSLNYSHSLPPDSVESEVEYLKLKLIETHSKLIQELQYSKELEEQLKDHTHQYDIVLADNDNLAKKLSNLNAKYEKDRGNVDRLRQMELNLVESEKKNDLLRVDLDSMRAKMLEMITTKQLLEEERADHEKIQTKLNDKLGIVTKQLKMKELAHEDLRQEVQRYKVKYDKQVSNNREIEMELNELRKEREENQRRNQELEAIVRQEREKHNKNVNQLLLMQKDAKEWKNRAEKMNEELIQAKEQVNLLKTRTKQDERNLSAELERLTNDYNNLQSMYRQRENQLDSVKRRPLEDATRKKNNFQQTKELVGKLEKEEQIKMSGRVSPTKSKERISPRVSAQPQRGYSRSYKQEKEEYLSMIESVGSMESQMLACNMQRKKILAEMDKIDETRVKTKEMISRRRRLQVELQNQQKRLEHTRNQLKKMKVM